jgi:hypothetical protein
MTEGFVLDNGPYNHVVSSWVEGPPRKSFWSGVTLRGRVQHPIQTWRCGRCGFLESYARG